VNITNIESIDFKAIPIKIYTTDFFIPTDKIENLKKICSYKNRSDNNVKLSKNMGVLKHKSLKNLNKLFKKVCDHYSTKVLGLKNNFTMTNSWSSLAKKGDCHHTHNHPNIVFSLIYYVTDNNGKFVVENAKSSIQENLNFDYEINEYNIYNSSSWTIDPRKGNIIAILGDLVHRTLPHEGDQDRIIIGANYFLDGNIGLHNDRYSAFKLKTSSI
tara:strand:+ start:948 stop:1592 length:645 start_codon:yes stop_codon:yes gene_type:complete